MDTRYNLSGMTCSHCAKHIAEEVIEIPGVDDVVVYLDEAAMNVVSKEPIPFEAISSAVTEAGDYQVSTS